MTATVGVIGGGQLARMMHQAAITLGIELRVLGRPGDAAAAAVVPNSRSAEATMDELIAFGLACDVLTFDHEVVDPVVIDAVERAGVTVLPSAACFSVAADKAEQRRVLGDAGLSVIPTRVITGVDDLTTTAQVFGWPLVLKKSSGGYDGRGFWMVAEVGAAMRVVDDQGPLLAEPLLPIERELAVLVARRPGGESVVYPTVESRQRDGICIEVISPAPVSDALGAEAEAIALAAAEAVGAVGILAVELFVVDGGLVINELAPRPHNTGHLTIEANATSQFENHLRAVLDWPLGSTEQPRPAAMVNIVARSDQDDPRERLMDALIVLGASVHLYGKEPRVGRKVGHVTATADTAEEAMQRARNAALLLQPEPKAVPV